MHLPRRLGFAVFFSLFLSGALFAGDPSDRTLSPYFWVKPTSAGLEAQADGIDPLPLKSTHVEVSIQGSFANVVVRQRYTNAATFPLEAAYVFPGSTRAAVHGLTLFVGERRIEAKVKEKVAARRVYEQAKTEGRTAGLLEQQRPNVFQMNVANILPGDEITVELRYSEFLAPTAGVYEFVYPGVVGPRYRQPAAGEEDPEDAWIANPYLRQALLDPSAYQIRVALDSPVALAGAQCRTHPVRIDYASPRSARIQTTDATGSNRDFILHYRLAGATIDSGLMVGEFDGEQYFLLMLQPPARPRPGQIPPREYVFIVDVSGSMAGFPLEISCTLMERLLGQLRPQDRFNLLLFAGGSELLAPASVTATPENVRSAVQMLEQRQGGGGTELLPALQRALSLPVDENASRSFVVITDGYVAIEREAFDLVNRHLGRANLFAFGIGSSVNRHLVEGLARLGQGEPFIATDAATAVGVAQRFADYVGSPVLTRLQASFEGMQAFQVEPTALPDLLAERPLWMIGKWSGADAGRIVVQGRTGDAEYVSELSLARAQRVADGAELARLWARTRIARLEDYARLGEGEDEKAEVVQLGLRYNLLTRHTSFVAVDDLAPRTTGDLRSVKQPLPLPAGVEDSALGAEVGAAPEPSTWALLGTAVVMLVVWHLRGRRVRS